MTTTLGAPAGGSWAREVVCFTDSPGKAHPPWLVHETARVDRELLAPQRAGVTWGRGTADSGPAAAQLPGRARGVHWALRAATREPRPNSTPRAAGTGLGGRGRVRVDMFDDVGDWEPMHRPLIKAIVVIVPSISSLVVVSAPSSSWCFQPADSRGDAPVWCGWCATTHCSADEASATSTIATAGVPPAEAGGFESDNPGRTRRRRRARLAPRARVVAAWKATTSGGGRQKYTVADRGRRK